MSTRSLRNRVRKLRPDRSSDRGTITLREAILVCAESPDIDPNLRERVRRDYSFLFPSAPAGSNEKSSKVASRAE